MYVNHKNVSGRRSLVAVIVAATTFLVAGCTTPQGATEPGARINTSEFATPGTINNETNPVDWTRLKSVPASFADGIDNDSLADLACADGEGAAWREGTLVCGAPGSGVAGWDLRGNSGTRPGEHFLGTLDAAPLELRVANQPIVRLIPAGNSPSIVSGHSGNAVSDGVAGSVVAGGGSPEGPNLVTDAFGTVAGGVGNRAGNAAGSLSDAERATVGGGYFNVASGEGATVAGGVFNVASGERAAVGGGVNNRAESEYATVAGGELNSATGEYSTVAGGIRNHALADNATVPGGGDNVAAGHASFAAGWRARAHHEGAFVWADGTNAELSSPGPHTFSVRASGGIWLGTTSHPEIEEGRFLATSTGAFLSAGGAWTDASDRNGKERFEDVDACAVLETVRSLAISTWSYTKDAPETRHMGPVAQEFHGAFGLGEDDRHIAPLDANGVALAAIQCLDSRTAELQRRIAAIEGRTGTQPSGARAAATGSASGAWDAPPAAIALSLLAGASAGLATSVGVVLLRSSRSS